MFSSQSTLNSVGRNAGISTTPSNYWYTEDNYPYVNLQPSGSTINATDIDTTNNILYLGGSFSRLYQNNANYHSIYDVSSSAFQIKSKNYGTNGSIYAYGLDTSNSILYVGGNFTSVTDNNDLTIDASYVAAWSIKNQRWTPLGRNKQNGLNDVCNALAVDISNQEVYVGGNFTKVRDSVTIDLSTNYVAKWKVSTGRWSQLGASDVSYNNGLKAMCRTLVYDSKNTQLYVGGDFTLVRDGRAIDLSANKIAIWKPSTSKWFGMGTLVSSNGTNGQISAYVYDSCKNVIYAGGSFTNVFDTSNIILSANRIAKWEIATSSWSRLGTATYNGLDGSCNALAMDTSNQILYVGGYFTTVYDSSNTNTLTNTQDVAAWNANTSSWSRLGSSTSTTNGLTSTSAYCNALLYDSSNSRLYVGGSFTKVGDAGQADQSANNVAYWNISTSRWAKLGTTDVSYNNGTDAYVNSMAYDGSYNRLYVGGNFTKARDGSSIDISMNYVGYWNISTSKWGQLGGTTSATNGLNAQCRTLAYDGSNAELYVGGDFTTAYNSSGSSSVQYSVKWGVSSSSWYAMGSSSGRTYTLNGSSQGISSGTIIYAVAYYNSIIYVGGSFTSVSSTNSGTVSASRIAAYNISSGTWSALSSGLSSTVKALALDSANNKLYVGGEFASAGGSSSNGLSVWNISNSTWSAFSSSVDGPVQSLAVDSTNQKLYVGGDFTSAGGVSSRNRIAVWNISNSTWSALSTGLNGSAYSLALDSTNQKLYVCGNFTSPASCVAVWNITNSSWSGLSSGVGTTAYSLALDSTNQKLYVGGNFTTANGSSISASYVAVWNISTSTWSALSSGLGSSAQSLILDSTNQKLYVGGSFTSAGGSSADRLAVWNITNSTWSALGSGTGSTVYALAFDSTNNELYVGGNFTTAGGSTATGAAIYSITNSTYYPVGNYSIVGPINSNGTNGQVYSFSLDTSNNRLYTGGNFTKVSDASTSDLSANYVAYWNIATSRWSQMGGSTRTTNGFDGSVNALVLDSNRNVFVGGNFTKGSTTARDISANKGIIWTPSTSKWTNLGGTYYLNGITDGSCNALALDSSNQRLYVGGSFNAVKDTSNISLIAKNIAYWDITNSVWKTMGGTTSTTNGLDGSCNALAFDSSNNRLYVGGNFKKVSDASKSDQSANYVAFWDASNSLWGQVGAYDFSKNGVDASVNALAFDSCKNILYVGGYFSKAYDSSFTLASPLSTQYLATWNPTTKLWSRIGYSSTSRANIYGLSNFCRALTYDPSKSSVYVGGDHTTTCDSTNISIDASNIAYINLNTGNIYPLGSTAKNGTNDKVNSIKLDTSNNVLYVDGSFTRVTDISANYIAKYDVSNQSWSSLGSSTSNGLGGMGKALFYDNINNAVYASGAFTSVRDGTTDSSKNFNYVAKWDVAKSAWSPLGSNGNGTNGSILTYAYDTANYRVFCGGSFTQVFDNSNTRLYANNVAVFDTNTSTWSVLGGNSVTDPSNNGINSICRTLVYDTSNSQLYVGGDFTQVRDGRGQDISANKIAIWKPSTSRWSGMGTLGNNGTNGQISAYVYDSCKNVMYAGGSFTIVYDSSNNIILSANRIAKWDIANSSWSRLGSATYNGLDGSCNALAMDTSNQILYVGGYFTTVYDSSNTNTLTNTQRVAAWNANTSSWSRLGSSTSTTNGLTSTSAYCSALAYDSSNSRLYVGGSFTKVGDAGQADQSANNVAYWNISTSRWAQLGGTSSTNNGLGSICQALAYDSSNNRLYVGGNFTTASDTTTSGRSANYVAYWNASSSIWAQLGGTTSATNGLNAQCRTLVYDSRNAELYVGGDFTTAYNSSGSSSAQYSVKWGVSSSSWYAMGSSSTVGRTYTLNGSSQGISSGTVIYAVAYYNSIIYVCGSFTSVSSTNSGTVSASNIAAYNISSGKWSALGTGLDSNGRYLAIDSANNKLYVGGDFTSAGGSSAYRLAVWNITNSTWSALGSGTDSIVYALALDSTNQKLYVGGMFSSAGGSSANYVAVWNISNSTWSALGSGLGKVVCSLALDSTNQKLYVGGEFTTAGEVSASYVAVWNISNSTWSALGSGLGNDVYAVALDSTNQKLYVGGLFSSAGGTSVSKIAVWNITNSSWSGLSSGVNGAVRALALDSTNQKLYVGGDFATANGTSISASRVAVYNISSGSWSALGSGVNTIVNGLAFDSTNNELYLGGYFTSSDVTTASYAAIYSITNSAYYPVGNYSIVGPIYNNGTNGQVYSFSLDTSNNRLYTGGNFTKVSDASTSDLSANYVAYWNIATSRWIQMGGTTSTTNGFDGSVNALVLDSTQNVFIGGNFTKASATAGDVSANKGIIWTPSTSKWTNLGAELYRNGLSDGSCNALALDTSNQRLYVGGSTFTTVKDSSNISLSANRIAYWNLNTSTWSGLGTTATAKNGLDGSCNALVLDPSFTRVYVGGNFKKVSDSAKSDQSANYIAYWDVSNSIWGKLGASDDSSNNGVRDIVRTLAYDNANAQLYVGGDFIAARDGRGLDLSINRVAIWKPSTKLWSGMGQITSNGTNGYVAVSTYDSSNNVIYVGGQFTEVYDTSNIRLYANCIAVWNISTNTWSRLTESTYNGVNTSWVTSIIVDKTKLYVSGSFTSVYDSTNLTLSNVNNMATWDLTTKKWSYMGGGTSSTTNGKSNGMSTMVFDVSNNVLYVSAGSGGSCNGYDLSGTTTFYGVGAFNLNSQRWSRVGYGFGDSSTTNGILQTNSHSVLAFDNSNSSLYVGAAYNAAISKVRDDRGIDISINSVARWDVRTQRWYGLGGHSSNGTNGQINAYAYDSSRNRMYVGGGFTRVFDLSNIWLQVNNVAAWDIAGKYWVWLGSSGTRNGVDASVNALAIDSSNSRLYVGGAFKRMSDASKADQSGNCVVYWDISNSLWGQMGGSTTATTGLDGSCNALAIDNSNGRVYVGGNFRKVSDSTKSDQSANYVAYWNVNTNTWSRLGASDVSYNNGLNNQCRSLVYDPSKTQLYVGGDFTVVRDGRNIDLSANKIAIWKPSTSQWSGMGTLVSSNGTNGQISAYVYDSCKNVIYAGGSFTSVFDTSNIILSANRIAKWDIANSSWSRLGTETYNGLDGSCNALAIDTSNQILYAGGYFTNVYDASGTLATTKKVATWTVATERWTRLGSTTSTTNGLTSTSAYCNALLYDSSNSRLYVGGNFTTVGDAGQADQSANNVAYWNISTSRWVQLGGTSSTNNGLGSICQALAYDSSNNRLYVGGNFTTASDTTTSDRSANYVAYWNASSSIWAQLGGTTSGTNGLNAQCRTLVYDSSNAELYVGGDFTTAYNNSDSSYVNYSVKWGVSSSSWYAMGSSSSSRTYTLNGSSQGITGTVYKVAYYNSIIYVCGSFTSVSSTNSGTVSASNIAAYNISSGTWSALGTGVNSNARDLALDSANNKLYVGGDFSSAGGISSTALAVWDISNSTWSAFSSSVDGGVVYSLALDSTNQKLYVGGGFMTANGTSISVSRVAVWNISTSSWAALGNGVGSFVFSLALDITNQKLYVGGLFTTANGSSANRVAVWDITNSSWAALGDGVGGNVLSLALDMTNKKLYVGGNFTTAGGVSSRNYIAVWDITNSTWSALGNGVNGDVQSLTLDSTNNKLYVGGSFTSAGGNTSIMYIAVWDITNSTWSALGSGVGSTVNALAFDSTRNELYLGGSFSTAGGTTASKAAIYSITNSTYYPVGNYSSSIIYSNGTNGQVYSFSLDTSNNRLYAGGNFTTTSDATTTSQTAKYIAYWNIATSRWSQMGGSTSTTNGFDGSVNALVLDSTQNVFIGGNFTKASATAGDVSANKGIIWTPSTSKWTNLGGGLKNGLFDGSCIAMALDSSNQRLYVGGSFTKVTDNSNGSLSANRIAYWNLNTSSWNALGSNTDVSKNGLDGSCNALIYDNSNNRLYVGGSFKKVSDSSQIDQSANYVVYWDVSNSIWKQLGGTTSTRNGASDMVNALAQDVSKNVFVGGRFISVNDSAYNTYLANYNAFWSPSTQTWSRLGSIVSNGTSNALTVFDMDIDTSNSMLYGFMAGSSYYLDVSNSSGIPGGNLCAWDIKNQCWVNMSNNTSTSVSNQSGTTKGVKVDYTKKRVYFMNSDAGGNVNTLYDSSNGNLKVNSTFYYDMIQKTFNPLGGAINSFKTLTNGIISSLTGTFNPYTDQTIGSKSLTIDNSGNCYFGFNNNTQYVCDNYQIQTAGGIAIWNATSNRWSVLGSNKLNGIDASCISMVYDNSNNELYVGGNFANTTDMNNDTLTPWNLKTPISKVAKWSVKNSRWTNIAGQRFDASNGTNGAIYASVYDSCKNIIYMGGNFTRVSDTSNGDMSANYVAAWDVSGQYWSRLGTAGNNGMNNVCSALAIDTSKQILYVGGHFKNVFDETYLDQSANFVAAWNISSQKWSILGASESVNGLDGSCNAFALDSSNSRLYVGGNFLKVSDSSKADQSANYVAYWEISNSLWKKLGVSDDSSNNGVKSTCRTLTYDQSNTQLYVGGDFILVRDGRGFDFSANKIAIWKPSQNKWIGMGNLGSNGTNGTILAYVYDSCKNVIYAGGSFTRVFDSSNIILTANQIAKWDIATSQWSMLGSATYNGIDGSCNALAMDTSNQILYVGGTFNTVYDSSNTNTLTNTKRVAAWNAVTQSWSRLGSSSATTNGLTSTSAYCNALAYDSSNSRLYVGGNFTTVGDSSNADFSANNVASWNVSTSRWFRVGANDVSYNNGLNLECRTLVYDQSNSQLYVGGDFITVRDGRGLDISTNRVAIWKPSTSKWSGMGSLGQNGTNGQILAYVYDSCKNVMYAGGSFTSVFDTSNIILSANRIAKWDIATSSWSRLTDSSWNGVDAACNSLAIDTSNQILYAGGSFTTVYDSVNTNTLTNTQRVAKWDITTSTWSRLGNSTIYTNGLTSTGAYCNALAYDSSNSLLYVGGNFTTVGDSSNADFSANHVAYWNVSTSRWAQLGNTTSTTNGLNLECRTLVYDQSNTQLYVGGDFTVVRDGRAVDISANKIAIWKPSTSKWFGMGTLGQNGTNGQISAYVYDSCKNVMYAGGSFTSVFDSSNIILSANRIAKWDIATSSWSRLGTSTYNGLDGSCNALAMDTSNQILYAGGYFTTVYDSSNTNTLTNTQRVAAWNANTSSWTRLGSSTSTTNGLTSTSAYCNALLYDSSNSRLYVGGNFTTVGDAGTPNSSANYVAYWNISTSRWAQLGGTSSTNNGLGSICQALAYDSSNNRLYVGGNFTTASDTTTSGRSANYVAYWNASSSIWAQLGGTTSGTNGLNAQCRTLVYDSSNAELYVGGDFTTVYNNSGSSSVNYSVKWGVSSSSWYAMGSSSSSSRTYTLNGSNQGTGAYILAVAYYNSIIYVGGAFTNVYSTNSGTVSATRIAAYNISSGTWSALGSGVDRDLKTLAIDSANNKLYVGGEFTTAGGITLKIAVWDITNSTWSALGDGVGGNVLSLALDMTNKKLYVGGNFTTAGGVSSRNYIAVWDITNSTWSALGNGVDNNVRALAIDSANNKLYVGGSFTSANGNSSIKYIAVWDITNSTWSALGNGVGSTVRALALDSTNNKLYVGGDFTTANGSSISASYVAVWNITTSSWSALGNGVGSTVNALALDSTNNKLYVGGDFITADGVSSRNYIAVWNITTSSWSALGSGTGGSVQAMVLDSTNKELYVGGNFITAGGTTASYAAIYSTTNSAYYPVGNYSIVSNYSNGTGGKVYSFSLDTSNNRLYTGGNFTKVSDASTSDLSANYVAYWNIATSRWSQMGGSTSTTNGFDGSVNAIAVDSNRNVFIGGNFTKASLSTGDTSANKGIIWTPSTSKWTNLGGTYYLNGVADLSVNALALDSSNQRLYVGGSFSRVRDSSNASLTTNRIAYWNLNTSTWNALGSNTESSKNGLDGSCNALAFDSSNNRLYVGGNFRKVHDTSKIDQSANYIAFWDASNSLWGQMGGSTTSTNGFDGSVNAIALDSNRNVFVGGNFTKASLSTGDTSANKGIIWTPSTSKWTNLGAGLYQNGVADLSVNALALDETNQRLYVGGSFSRVRDSSNISLTTNRIAYFNLNTSSWNAVGSNTDPSKNGLDGSCNALAFDQTNNRLYVGGNFRKVHDTSKIDQSANYIAFWDASNSLWGQMGGSTTSTNGFDGSVNAIVLDSNRNVFVGGTFTKASLSTGDTSANNGVIWNPTTSKWINIGVDRNRCGFTDGSVNALALDPTNQRLYVGGSFTRANDSSNSNLSTANVAYWDVKNSVWYGLGTTDSSKNGLNSRCRTLNYNTSNTTLYAGGDFTRASDSTGYDLSANRIASWNPSTGIWSPFGSAFRNANNGLNNEVYTISTAQNNQVFVGGTFTGGNDISGSITSNYGLIWNPSSYKWSKFGGYSGITNDGSINALAIDSSYTKLFIGGNFSRMSDNCGNSYTVNDGAIWNINSQTLSAMGSFNLNGLNFYPNVFAMDTYNNVLYMGGNFTTAYDDANSSSSIFAMYVIGYDITNNKWIQLGNEAWNGVTGEVTSLSFDQNNYILYVSGNYNRMFDGTNGLQSVNYIAAYNVYSKTWGRLGSSTYNGTSVAPNSIAFNGSSKLYVGGNFTSVYDSSNSTLTVKYMAAWDTEKNTWSRVGANTTYNGVDASVNILQYNGASNYLLTVGNFSNINDSVNTKVRQIPHYATYKF